MHASACDEINCISNPNDDLLITTFIIHRRVHRDRGMQDDNVAVIERALAPDVFLDLIAARMDAASLACLACTNRYFRRLISGASGERHFRERLLRTCGGVDATLSTSGRGAFETFSAYGRMKRGMESDGERSLTGEECRRVMESFGWTRSLDAFGERCSSSSSLSYGDPPIRLEDLILGKPFVMKNERAREWLSMAMAMALMKSKRMCDKLRQMWREEKALERLDDTYVTMAKRLFPLLWSMLSACSTSFKESWFKQNAKWVGPIEVRHDTSYWELAWKSELSYATLELSHLAFVLLYILRVSDTEYEDPSYAFPWLEPDFTSRVSRGPHPLGGRPNTNPDRMARMKVDASNMSLVGRWKGVSMSHNGFRRTFDRHQNRLNGDVFDSPFVDFPCDPESDLVFKLTLVGKDPAPGTLRRMGVSEDLCYALPDAGVEYIDSGETIQGFLVDGLGSCVVRGVVYDTDSGHRRIILRGSYDRNHEFGCHICLVGSISPLGIAGFVATNAAIPPDTFSTGDYARLKRECLEPNRTFMMWPF